MLKGTQGYIWKCIRIFIYFFKIFWQVWFTGFSRLKLMKILAKRTVSQLDSQLQDDNVQFLTSFSGGNEFVISAGMSCWYLGSMEYFTPL